MVTKQSNTRPERAAQPRAKSTDAGRWGSKNEKTMRIKASDPTTYSCIVLLRPRKLVAA